MDDFERYRIARQQEFETQRTRAETYLDAADASFLEALPRAAERIIQLALHDPDPKIALRAATYIVERNLGRSAMAQKTTAAERSIEGLIEELQTDS